MRNVLSELPVFLCCLWGGLAAGLAAFLIRLPRKLYGMRLRGKKAKALYKALFAVFDIAAALLAAAVFALTLYTANGGEMRAFAVGGFVSGAASVSAAANRLISGG